MSESTAHEAIEAVARDSYGRLVAYIAARTGDIADAQDALSEAIAESNAGSTRSVHSRREPRGRSGIA